MVRLPTALQDRGNETVTRMQAAGEDSPSCWKPAGVPVVDVDHSAAASPIVGGPAVPHPWASFTLDQASCGVISAYRAFACPRDIASTSRHHHDAVARQILRAPCDIQFRLLCSPVSAANVRLRNDEAPASLMAYVVCQDGSRRSSDHECGVRPRQQESASKGSATEQIV